MTVANIAVIGAGTMGASITVALVAAKLPVLLKDTSEAALTAGLARIDKMQQSRMKKGLSEADAQAERNLIKTVHSYDDLGSADLVIEAASENLDVKRAIFQDLDKHCRPDAILASNTSGLPISLIASFSQNPERVIGLHFFNPAHIMKLVEVVPGLATSSQTVDQALAFGRAIGKLAVRVEECPSFLVNRLLARYTNESLWCLLDGSASIAEIDKAACDFAMPIGPLALRDMNGADIGLAVARFNYQEYGERYNPPPLLAAMVEKNLLGQKTGAGFYTYDAETRKRQEPNPAVTELAASLRTPGATLPFRAERLFLPMINEAFLALQERICAPGDLDPALKAGLGMSRGPLEMAHQIGFADCLKQLEELQTSQGERFRPANLLKRYAWSGRQSLFD